MRAYKKTRQPENTYRLSTVRISEMQAFKIEKFASDNNITQSDAIRRIINESMDNTPILFDNTDDFLDCKLVDCRIGLEVEEFIDFCTISNGTSRSKVIRSLINNFFSIYQ